MKNVDVTMNMNHCQTMGLLVLLSITGMTLTAVKAQTPKEKPEDSDQAISSKIEKTKTGDLILVETVIIDAPVSKVWAAYTTSEGFASWSAPVAEVDLRLGGSIRTHYDPNAKIGDPKTITLRIINYVPQKVLTLQADVSENWPEVLKAQAEHLYNVILFEQVTANRTRIVSYGVGYQDNKEMRGMLNFFVPANQGLYKKLKKVLEAKQSKSIQ